MQLLPASLPGVRSNRRRVVATDRREVRSTGSQARRLRQPSRPSAALGTHLRSNQLSCVRDPCPYGRCAGPARGLPIRRAFEVSVAVQYQSASLAR